MKSLLPVLLLATSGAALAAPVTYTIDPTHTFPSFAADHFGGLSVWRGKFKTTAGRITLDAAAQTGTVDITVQADSIDTGYDKLDAHVRSAERRAAAKCPTATYQGKLVDFKDGKPTAGDGTFTLHGVTKPLRLAISHFQCQQNPMNKLDTCGAEASATFQRDAFGVDYGKGYGFKMDVTLAIQVEGTKAP